MAAMLKAAEGRAAASVAIRAETKAAADYSERAREGREEARELAREERDKASERARVERDVAREQCDHEELGELRKALVDSRRPKKLPSKCSNTSAQAPLSLAHPKLTSCL
jgi:hypothetical protein